jgi:hypothetical protein
LLALTLYVSRLTRTGLGSNAMILALGDVPSIVENGEADAAIRRLRSFSALSKSAVV